MSKKFPITVKIIKAKNATVKYIITRLVFTIFRLAKKYPIVHSEYNPSRTNEQIKSKSGDIPYCPPGNLKKIQKTIHRKKLNNVCPTNNAICLTKVLNILLI